MSHERGGGGNGAVVAIVVVLAILVIFGVGIVGMGALLFVGARQVAAVSVAPPDPPIPPAPPATVEPELAPAALDQPRISIEVTTDQKLLVAGEEMSFDKLKETLQAGVDAGAPPKVMLAAPNSDSDSELKQQVIKLLMSLEIAFESKSN
jgi:hypothetical protein